MRFWQIDGVSRGKLIIVLILLYCLMVANVLVPTIRLSLQPANYLLFGLSQLIPLFIIGVSARLRGWQRYVGIVTGVLLLLPAAPLGLGAAACTAFSVADGGDASFERIYSLTTPRGIVAVYRTNGGATTSFGIVIRQECRLAPGLLVVQILGGEYPAEEARLEVLSEAEIQARFPPYGDRRLELTVQTLRLRKLPCLYVG